MSARILLLVAAVFCATAPIHVEAAPRQNARDTEAVEPNAGNWKTWVIPSGKDYLVPPPPGAAATRAELRAMADIMSGHDAQVQQQIEFWNAGAPSYRWVDNINARVFAGLPATPFAHRAVHVRNPRNVRRDGGDVVFENHITTGCVRARSAAASPRCCRCPGARPTHRKTPRRRRRRLRCSRTSSPTRRRRTRQWPNRPGGHGCRPAFNTRVITSRASRSDAGSPRR